MQLYFKQMIMYFKTYKGRYFFPVAIATTISLVVLTYLIDLDYNPSGPSKLWEPSTSLVKNASTYCLLWSYPPEVKSYENPQIKLDPNRFFYPGLTGGFNNQIIGLKESTFIAISLNRTLVIPKFHGQHTQSGAFSPYQAIEVDRLCRFVSCISVEKLREKCGDSFDVLFQLKLHTNYQQYIERYESDSGMQILHPTRVDKTVSFPSRLALKHSKLSFEIPVLPGLNSTRKPGESFSLDSTSLRTEYDTQAPCAIAAAVFDWIKMPLQAKIPAPLKATINHLKATNVELMSSISDAVRHPPCIARISKDYIRDIFKNRKYVALHWRFDRQDWMHSYCRRKNFTHVNLRNACLKVKNAKAAHVANSLVKTFENKLKISMDTLNQTRIPIYIASPPTTHKFRDEIYKSILKINKRFMKPALHISRYLRKKYKHCWKDTGWENREEIFSLCEMEIMTYSEWFFFSHWSTWSGNVRLLRLAIDTNENLNELFQKSILDIM